MDFDVLLIALAIDLVAITILTYGLYFRRHRRRDLTLGFMGVNVGLFAVASFVSTRPVGLAFGIGLFALLSVIRLRSTLITQEEIGYYFVAIVIGLANGLSPDAHWGITITLTAVLVGVMYVADHPRVLRNYQRRVVRLKSVYSDEAELRRVLEHKLGGTVVNMLVIDVDYVHKQTRVDVRFRPDPPGTHPPKPKARSEVPSPMTTDALAPLPLDRETSADEEVGAEGATTADADAEPGAIAGAAPLDEEAGEPRLEARGEPGAS